MTTTDERERIMNPQTPRDEPYWITANCSDCNASLILHDEAEGREPVWYDEWMCPDCRSGIYLDVPPGKWR